MAYRMTTFAIAATCALLTAPVAADVKRGVDAWTAGDYVTAVSEWQQPAQAGDADALFNLGQAYRLGRGVSADIVKARELYQQAAQKGHVKAADNYGLLLFQQGEQKAAMRYIEAAADRGDPRAQYVLGLAHFNADYAEKDWVRAYALLTLSQGAGLPQATGALKQMDQYVPITQREQAQTLARQIEAESAQRRAAELAAADLKQRDPAPLAQPTVVQTASARPVRQSNVRLPKKTPASVPAPVVASTSASSVQPAVAEPVRVASRQSVPAAAPGRVPAPAEKTGRWGIQLGAFGVASNADRLWAKLSGNPVLEGTQKKLVPGGRVTRLRAVGFATRADASSACAKLSRQGQACVVAKPSA